MTAAERWRRALEGWAIPDRILDAAPESPWGFPPELFARRAKAMAEQEPSAATLRALEALPRGGTVLDVGVGGGATSLSLAGRASLIAGVDTSDGMLEAFRSAAAAAGIAAETVHGEWPEVAHTVPQADVVVSGHVLYNVPELGPFARELTTHARHRVVVEATGRHPLAWMNDLWMRFHGLERPEGPTADDAEEVLREIGLDPEREDQELPSRSGGFERREDAIALVRRRLCLPAERDLDLAEALGVRLAQQDGRWSAGPAAQTLVTLWWDGQG